MKHITIKNTGIISLISIFLFCSGCSSDNNSETSSGGGSTTSSTTTTATPASPVEPAPVSSIAGTYIGTATATASALGLSESETIPVTITVSEDGRVTIESGSDIFPDVITLNGNTFSYSQTFVDESFGSSATCSGTLTLQGSIDNNGSLTATLSSQSVVCNGIPGTVAGSLSATKQ